MPLEIKYFYLTDGLIGLHCLKHLIKNKYIPELIISHKTYQYNKLKETFYIPLEELVTRENISLIKLDSIKDYEGTFDSYHIGICIGFMEILKKEIFDAPLLGIFNLHCGKLPEYRGRAPISRAIINGENSITITVHKIESGVDSGEIILEKNIPILDDDDVNTLYAKCSEYSGEVIVEVFKIIEKNNLIYFPGKIKEFIKAQNECLKPAFKEITKSERIIVWNKSAREIFNLIRGLTPPYPSAITYFKSLELMLTKAKIINNEIFNSVPGYIEIVEDGSITVHCQKGIIQINEIISNGKFLKNFKELFKSGDILK